MVVKQISENRALCLLTPEDFIRGNSRIENFTGDLSAPQYKDLLRDIIEFTIEVVEGPPEQIRVCSYSKQRVELEIVFVPGEQDEDDEYADLDEMNNGCGFDTLRECIAFAKAARGIYRGDSMFVKDLDDQYIILFLNQKSLIDAERIMLEFCEEENTFYIEESTIALWKEHNKIIIETNAIEKLSDL